MGTSWNTVEGNWKSFKGTIKEKWGKLTDDELDVINGKRDKFLGALEKKYGYTSDAAREQVEKFLTEVNVDGADKRMTTH